MNVALPDGVPSQARQLRDDWHLTASRHPGQEVVDISQSLSTVQAPFKRRARGLVEGPVLSRAACTGKMPRQWLIRSTVPLGMADGWPVGLPLCRPLSGGLWEVRASLPSKREARIFFGFHDGLLVAVHAIINKTQKTPAEDLALARQRFRELQSWQGKTRT